MTQVHPGLPISREELDAFCERWGIKELALFGSAARGELREDSDIDFLIEFQDGARIGLREYFAIRDQLTAMVGRPIDLASSEMLRNPYRRASVLRDLSVLMPLESRDESYLADMRRYATQVASYVQGMTFDDFAPESLLRLGVERGIEVVDEAAGRVSTSVREAHSEVPWGQIIALRNVIAHGYATEWNGALGSGHSRYS